MAGRKISVEIVGDADSFKRALGTAADHTDRFGSALGGLAKAGVLAAGAAGVGGLFVTLKAGIGEFSQSTKVAAQTAAVIKSTGGAANVTSKHVDALATSIMNYSGIDDEAIKSGENMLLTFKNIRNEAGKGNDIFDQSTKILTDMSVALGGDASKNAIRLGKALNDPIKGVTALTKVGVTFSDAQKNTIKSLVDSGNAAGAQKIILQELNSEFGGSAKAAGDTLPGQINKLKETFNNFAGDLVAKAVPAVSSFVGFLSEKGLPALGDFFSAVSDRVGPVIASLVSAFQSAAPGILSVLSSIGSVITNDVAPIFEELGRIGREAIAKIGDVMAENGPQIHQIFENLGTVISNLGNIVIPILKVAFDTVLPVAIRVLIPVLKIVTDAIALVSSVASTTITDTVKVFTEGPGKVRDAFVAAWNAIKGAFGTAFDAVKTYAIDPISDVVRFFREMPGRIAGALSAGANDAVGALKKAISRVFDFLPGFVKDILGIQSPSTVFAEIGKHIIGGAVKGIEAAGPKLVAKAKDVFGSIEGIAKNLVGGFLNIFDDPGTAAQLKKMHQQAVEIMAAGPRPSQGGMGGPMSSSGLVAQVVNALGFARSHGWHGSVTSGFRSYAEQAALYQRYLHGGPLAAKPGTSSHEFGQAVDVTDYGTFGRLMSIAPAFERLYNHLGSADPVHFSVTGYDKGGLLPTGISLVGNFTGRPEVVTPAGAGEFGGGDLHIHFDGPVYADERGLEELTSKIRTRLYRHQNRSGTLGFT
jgi:hypothetical protein